jgi:hypothetical protein
MTKFFVATLAATISVFTFRAIDPVGFITHSLSPEKAQMLYTYKGVITLGPEFASLKACQEKRYQEITSFSREGISITCEQVAK